MQCNQCGMTSDIRSDFAKKGTTLCKKCDSHNSKVRRRTKFGVVVSMYAHQKRNAKIRGHHAPTYTRKELGEWLFSQKYFHELYDEWVISGYDKMLKPSCDRDDCLLSYTFSNITLMTWEENHNKARDEIKKGLVGAKSKPVYQFTLDHVFIRRFISFKSIKKELGYDDGFIIKVCKGKHKYKTAYGFLWEYAND